MEEKVDHSLIAKRFVKMCTWMREVFLESLVEGKFNPADLRFLSHCTEELRQGISAVQVMTTPAVTCAHVGPTEKSSMAEPKVPHQNIRQPFTGQGDATSASPFRLHPRSPSRKFAKMTDDLVVKILELAAMGYTNDQIHDLTGINPGAASRLRNGSPLRSLERFAGIIEAWRASHPNAITRMYPRKGNALP